MEWKWYLLFASLGTAMSFLAEVCPKICLMPPYRGMCEGRIPRYFYNKTTDACETYMWTGCMGSQNDFPDLYGCMLTCKVWEVFRSREKPHEWKYIEDDVRQEVKVLFPNIF